LGFPLDFATVQLHCHFVLRFSSLAIKSHVRPMYFEAAFAEGGAELERGAFGFSKHCRFSGRLPKPAGAPDGAGNDEPL